MPKRNNGTFFLRGPSDFSQNTLGILEEFMKQMTSATVQLISKANFEVFI